MPKQNSKTTEPLPFVEFVSRVESSKSSESVNRPSMLFFVLSAFHIRVKVYTKNYTYEYVVSTHFGFIIAPFSHRSLEFCSMADALLDDALVYFIITTVRYGNQRIVKV